MIDCTTQAQSGDDDMGGDNVAVSMEESKMDDFFQEVVMVVMMMSIVRIMIVLRMPVNVIAKRVEITQKHVDIKLI